MNSKEYQKYQISNAVYRELVWFCRQYNDMCRELAACYGITAVRYDGIGCKSNQISDPTADKSEKAMRIAADIDTINEALVQTASEPVREYLKTSVTNGIKYEYLGNVPMGRRQFYELRRKFFYNLKCLKKG